MKKDGNWVNLERGREEVLHLVRIAPADVQSKITLKADDYGLKCA
jgi:hypothetical protein